MDSLCAFEGSLMKMELFSSHNPLLFSSPDVRFVHAVLYKLLIFVQS